MGLGSVADLMDDSKDNHKVHFEVDRDLVGKDNEITVQKKGDKIDVHLGFLQVNHRYKINFSIPKSLCESKADDPVTLLGIDNPHLQVISATTSQDLIDLHLELYAHKEKLMVEEFGFCLSDLTNPITVVLVARVLGKGKGTPLLKNEIHVIHAPPDVDSDSSSDQ
uniref:Adipose-secreted signaling protein n=1 Tax=Graphocephala atropunctata TaxID=36148 RepID=A0A1B6M325_9HEMI